MPRLLVTTGAKPQAATNEVRQRVSPNQAAHPHLPRAPQQPQKGSRHQHAGHARQPRRALDVAALHTLEIAGRVRPVVRALGAEPTSVALRAILRSRRAAKAHGRKWTATHIHRAVALAPVARLDGERLHRNPRKTTFSDSNVAERRAQGAADAELSGAQRGIVGAANGDVCVCMPRILPEEARLAAAHERRGLTRVGRVGVGRASLARPIGRGIRRRPVRALRARHASILPRLVLVSPGGTRQAHGTTASATRGVVTGATQGAGPG
mmetsp:Transcript_21607/g.69551  ORF Transcript_21607/g.69551 Transcript_21607/m.69551 type:complete len:267 (+) Transcript_21607:1941-2741(+)